MGLELAWVADFALWAEAVQPAWRESTIRADGACSLCRFSARCLDVLPRVAVPPTMPIKLLLDGFDSGGLLGIQFLFGIKFGFERSEGGLDNLDNLVSGFFKVGSKQTCNESVGLMMVSTGEVEANVHAYVSVSGCVKIEGVVW